MSLQVIELVLFAGLAAIVLFMLYSVLGRRVGRQPQEEAAGLGASGVGCYYDDELHQLAGLQGDTWQSLYHFSVGMPDEDPRLTTLPPYP